MVEVTKDKDAANKQLTGLQTELDKKVQYHLSLNEVNMYNVYPNYKLNICLSFNYIGLSKYLCTFLSNHLSIKLFMTEV